MGCGHLPDLKFTGFALQKMFENFPLPFRQDKLLYNIFSAEFSLVQTMVFFHKLLASRRLAFNCPRRVLAQRPKPEEAS